MTNVETLRNITPDDIIAELDNIDSQMEELKKLRKDFETDLNAFVESEVRAQLADKDYGCGTATISTEKNVIKAVVTKKVDWDQEKLKAVVERIKAGNQNLEEYVDVTYKVSETKYKAWPTVIQQEFEAARTVTPSSTKLNWEAA